MTKTRSFTLIKTLMTHQQMERSRCIFGSPGRLSWPESLHCLWEGSQTQWDLLRREHHRSVNSVMKWKEERKKGISIYNFSIGFGSKNNSILAARLQRGTRTYGESDHGLVWVRCELHSVHNSPDRIEGVVGHVWGLHFPSQPAALGLGRIQSAVHVDVVEAVGLDSHPIQAPPVDSVLVPLNQVGLLIHPGTGSGGQSQFLDREGILLPLFSVIWWTVLCSVMTTSGALGCWFKRFNPAYHVKMELNQPRLINPS